MFGKSSQARNERCQNTVLLSRVEWLFWTTCGCCVYIIGGRPACADALVKVVSVSYDYFALLTPILIGVGSGGYSSHQFWLHSLDIVVAHAISFGAASLFTVR